MVVVWADGERAAWLARAQALEHGLEQPDWVLAATGADRFSDLTAPQVSWLIARGPEASARALLATPLFHHPQKLDLGLVAAARFELDALPYVLREAAASPDRLGCLVGPFRTPEARDLIAGWTRHLGSARLWARRWLERHGEALPPAATKTRPRKPKIPPWPLPPAPVDSARLLDALSRSRLADPPEPPPAGGVESSAATQPLVAPPDPQLRELLAGGDRASLAAFGRAVLRAWIDDGMPPQSAWALLAQAHLGDDATIDELAPLVRSWPGQSRYARAIDGHAVLATVGTDTALRHLLAIEERMSGGATNDRVADYLGQAAAARGLTPTRLADRLAPTHGLDAGVTVDYGPRRFTVVLDDLAAVHPADADGRRLAKLPRPGAKDTNPAAYKAFQQLTRDVRATVTAQAARLERDMLRRRLRPAADLSSVVLPHPLLGPLARRLLWGEYAGKRLVRALRIAEDGSLADLDDRAAPVAGDAELGIVHPAELGADLPAWSRLFLDYAILPPFPQLNRPVVILGEAERAATSLAGFGPVPMERLQSLLHNGWPGDADDFRYRRHMRLRRALPDGLTLLVELDPGLPTGPADPQEQHRIAEIWADDARSHHWQRTRRIPMGACDPIALSELLVEMRVTVDATG
ncbi:DUF4132 domain-containing protein [Dactylosporangium vinaceum]|uniref:DUF4132 domain-containing protein n=1 Tax=Dactylosporangium vinaceum TaxID=53362 RepID=A0ABV5MJ72_9ACTN|nr:DUF4132 domain-containing protein [Dactylosporangium vinaceum]UAB93673.1 DUF4132 domain-containing protein [Dactylosporangium vinaceum]